MFAEVSLPVQVGAGIGALVVLVYGADVAVERLKAVACYYEIPDVLIGLTIVSVGTSLPELSSHLTASVEILLGAVDFQIASALVLGANIGSDVVQQTLIVGVVVLFSAWTSVKHVFSFDEEFLRTSYLPMIGVHLMTLVLAWDGVLSRLDGLVLFTSFCGYIYYLFRTREHRFATETEKCQSVPRAASIALLALIGVVISAHILLKLTEVAVAATGLGGSIIGVMTLGIAAALPELSTAIQGLRRDATGISIGTLIGSNITNPLLAIGAGAAISTYWVPRPLVLWDLPMQVVTASLLLGYLLFVSDRKLGWKGGLYLVGLYVFYVIIRFTFFAVD